MQHLREWRCGAHFRETTVLARCQPIANGIDVLAQLVVLVGKAKRDRDGVDGGVDPVEFSDLLVAVLGACGRLGRSFQFLQCTVPVQQPATADRA